MAACDSASWTAGCTTCLAVWCEHDSCRMAHHHLTAHSHDRARTRAYSPEPPPYPCPPVLLTDQDTQCPQLPHVPACSPRWLWCGCQQGQAAADLDIQVAQMCPATDSMPPGCCWTLRTEDSLGAHALGLQPAHTAHCPKPWGRHRGTDPKGGLDLPVPSQQPPFRARFQPHGMGTSSPALSVQALLFRASLPCQGLHPPTKICSLVGVLGRTPAPPQPGGAAPLCETPGRIGWHRSRHSGSRRSALGHSPRPRGHPGTRRL